MKNIIKYIQEEIVRKNPIDESIVKGHISKKENKVFISQDNINDLINSKKAKPFHIIDDELYIYNSVINDKRIIKEEWIKDIIDILNDLLNKIKDPKFNLIHFYYMPNFKTLNIRFYQVQDISKESSFINCPLNIGLLYKYIADDGFENTWQYFDTNTDKNYKYDECHKILSK